jgi:hypothetical protein
MAGEQEIPLPEWVAAWDLSQTLTVRREIEFDLDRVRADARLPDGQLAVSVVYGSEFEDEACRLPINQPAGTASVALEATLSGRTLGAAVKFHTSLVLDETLNPPGGPVAWRRGSILWQDTRKLRLYGDASQFPLMEVDFRAFNLDPAAPWFLQVGSDLELPAMGSIILMLNERFDLVRDAARELDPDRPELAVVRSALYADIGRVLVETALSHDDIAQEWPEESLGAVLSALLASRFTQPVNELRRIRDNDPATWAALLDARFGFLRAPLR